MEAAAAADAKRFCEFCSYFEGSSKEVEEHTITCEFKLRHEQAKLDFLKKMKKAKELKETNKQISESLEKVKLEYEISEIELAISKMKEEPPLSSTPWKPKKKKQTTDSDKGIQSTIVKQEPPSSTYFFTFCIFFKFQFSLQISNF